MSARKSIFSGGRKQREDEADDALDQALKKLATATQDNTDACQQVRSKSSAGLRIVSTPPPKL